MQVIGICRFSYPAIGGFQVEHATPSARAAYLYDPARMAARFRLFEAFTLPSLRAQEDTDFTLIVVVGDDLPAPYAARLMALLAGVPQAVLLALAPGRHRSVMQSAIASVRRPGARSLQFRLDDDDAIAVDFIARLRAEAGRRAGALSGARHIAIDFRRGYLASPAPSGILAAPVNRPLIAAGLGVAFEAGVSQTVMNFAHNRLARWMPVFEVADRPMYVRGMNAWNDSRANALAMPPSLRPLDTEGEALFRSRFGIDADTIRASFPDAPQAVGPSP